MTYGNHDNLHFVCIDINDSKIPLHKVSCKKRPLEPSKDFSERFKEYFKIEVKQNEEALQTPKEIQILELLSAFYEEYGISFDVTFSDRLYIRFFMRELFHPNVFSKDVDEYSVFVFCGIISLIKNIQAIMK